MNKLLWNNALPIISAKDKIIETIKKNRAVIISGDTGCGKTTQLPKFCLAAGRGKKKIIGCTQPRRIAAITAAARIAEELGPEAGNMVGCKIRFKDTTTDDTRIKILTDGMLLAETSYDRMLKSYDTIIVDEAHERSLNIDFVIGILRTLLKKRRDLKVIITSATIDTEKFSKAFNLAPVIHVSGRMYPVETVYAPIDKADQEEAAESALYIQAAVRETDRIDKKGPYGNILIFMPTEQDIRETCTILNGKNYKETQILPLFARLSVADQKKIFNSGRGRKIIVSTNIAETSVTIPDVKYVIDTGLARVLYYSPRAKVTSLPIMQISKSSADQRKGRCGRVQNGVCIRLYSEKDYQDRALYTLPEILRTNLAGTVLKMLTLKLEDIYRFPFIDPPQTKNIQDGFNLLSELGAIEKDEKNGHFVLTDTGKIMADIPIDPRLSRILIESVQRGCLEEAIIIASFLSIMDPRERPAEKTKEADIAHKLFKDNLSDFSAILNIWKHTKDKKSSELKNFCKKNFLSGSRIREWRDIYSQIRTILQERNISQKQKTTDNTKKNQRFTDLYTAVHKSIISGFISNIALKKEKNLFTCAKGRQAYIFPGSCISDTSYDWIIGAELVKTSKLFIRKAAVIDKSWLEEIGKQHCKYSILNPRWDIKTGRTIASQQVTLFGLIIENSRPVNYFNIDPKKASEIFFQALALEDIDQKDIEESLNFLEYNKSIVQEIKDLENRLRRRDIFAGEDTLINFYKEKLGLVSDIRTLKKIIREKGGDSFLKIDRQMLVNYTPSNEDISLFPEKLQIGGHDFDCTYKFDPDTKDDGITIKIPYDIAGNTDPNQIDWLVPGLYIEKIEALIKALPPNYKKRLMPANTFAKKIAENMETKTGSLAAALSDLISRNFKIDIPINAWDEENIPRYLKAAISITGPDGTKLKSGKDKSLLKQNIRPALPPKIKEIKAANEKLDIKQWDFGDLKDSIKAEAKDSTVWNLYPGLKAMEDGSIGIYLYLNCKREEHIKGVKALIEKHLSKDIAYIRKSLTLPKDVSFKNFKGVSGFKDMVLNKIADSFFLKDIRKQEEFYLYITDIKQKIGDSASKTLSLAILTVKAFEKTLSNLDAIKSNSRFKTPVASFISTLIDELCRLIPENFVEIYENKDMLNLPRYIEVFNIRAEKGLVNLEKELLKAKEVQKFSDQLENIIADFGADTGGQKKKEAEELFWLIEEYKVSVFAQELKTSVKVSAKKLSDKIAAIKRL